MPPMMMMMPPQASGGAAKALWIVLFMGVLAGAGVGGYFLYKATADPYDFYAGADSDANDLRLVDGSVDRVDQLKTACTADASCMGFNTNAWLKSKINPKVSWKHWSDKPTQGMYVNRSRHSVV